MRLGKLNIRGRLAQKKIEKAFRRDFWSTTSGRQLEEADKHLPGHVRIMIPEVRTIAKSEREYLLMIELAKSASTRNLIGSVLKHGDDVEGKLRTLEQKTKDEGLKRRILQVLRRFERGIKQNQPAHKNEP